MARWWINTMNPDEGFLPPAYANPAARVGDVLRLNEVVLDRVLQQAFRRQRRPRWRSSSWSLAWRLLSRPSVRGPGHHPFHRAHNAGYALRRFAHPCRLDSLRQLHLGDGERQHRVDDQLQRCDPRLRCRRRSHPCHSAAHRERRHRLPEPGRRHRWTPPFSASPALPRARVSRSWAPLRPSSPARRSS